MELNNQEQLAIAQAMYKHFAALVSTKDPDSLRAAVDDEMRQLYEQTGAKSFDVKLCGEKVGTYSLTIAKDKPESTETRLQVNDGNALMQWCISEGFAAPDMDAILQHFDKCGEVPDGCEAVTVTIPADPGGHVARTTLKVDEVKVAEVAMENNLTAFVDPIAGRLTDGN